jgi:hypothetical protein
MPIPDRLDWGALPADWQQAGDVAARVVDRVPRAAMSRCTEIGTAGEHIVCADLLLSGYRASLAAQGLPYDVILDADGRLIRVAVKSTGAVATRPPRENNRICYHFSVSRSRRLRTGKTDARGYTAQDTDLIAFVALDLRLVAYCHIRECARCMQFDPPGTPPPLRRQGLTGRSRKTFSAFSLKRALAVHTGEVVPLPLKGRAA